MPFTECLALDEWVLVGNLTPVSLRMQPIRSGDVQERCGEGGGGGLKVSQGVSTNVITVGKFHRSFGETSYKFRKLKGSKFVDRAN